MRANHIAQGLVRGILNKPVTVHVLASREVTAYSFPSGDIFLTAAYIDRANDGEVAAAIAHELGHLLSNGRVTGPVALREKNQDPNAEARADAVGCEILRLRGIPDSAMINALELVASHDDSQRANDDLLRRIEILKSRASQPAP